MGEASRVGPRSRRGLAGAWRAPALNVGVWLVGAGVFFRAQWETGFRNLMGNSGDTSLIVYLLEHWFTVLHGRASWSSPAFFWPVKGVLGWSDGLVLFEVFYTPLRLAGCDQFLAAQLTVVFLSLVGFLSFVAVVRDLFSPPRWLALAGGLVFTFANDLWVNVGRLQLLGVWIVPFLVWLALRALRARSRLRSITLGALFGVLEGLFFFTSYYVAWFCVLAAALAAIAAFAVSPRRVVAARDRWIVGKWPAWVAAAAGFAVALIPFLDVYLPARQQVLHSDYRTVVELYGAHLHDLLNQGPGNIFWGSSMRSLVPSIRLSGSEMDYAVTPILLTCAVLGSVAAAWASRRRAGRASERAVIAAGAAASAVVLSFLPVRFHSGSLWIVAWHLPGGSAIRAIDRVALLAGVMAVTALVAAGSELWDLMGRGDAGRVPRRRAGRVVIIAVVALIVVEQVNTQVTSGLNRPQQLALLRSVPAAPSGCRSFYLTDGPHPDVLFFVFQIDAMLISQKVGLPTINGYTGYDPKGWSLQSPGPGYAAGVDEWIAAHRLRDVCRLDLADMTWTAPTLSNRPGR